MSKPTKVIYDIRIADGDEGKRLAPVQAQAILDVLTWAAKQATAAETDLCPPSTES